MSCSTPNLQQIPRGEYRECFVPRGGCVFIRADYSQIELRIVTYLSGDENMQHAYREGRDLHRITAARTLGKTEEEVTNEERQCAKAVNFGVIYGIGVKKLREYAMTNYGVALSDAEAHQWRNGFFDAYPAVKEWQDRETQEPSEVLINANGRRRRLEKPRDSYTLRLNTPVQSVGADGLKAALGLLWKRRDQIPGVRPVMVIHDEIIVEVPEDQAETAKEWLESVMVDAMQPMLGEVPVVAEASIARSYGDK